MAGLRATTSGLTWIHHSSFPCTGVRRMARFYTLQEVSPLVLNKAPSTLRQRNLKKEVSLSKRIKSFPSTLRRRNLKTQQSAVILDLCLSKIRVGGYYDYCNVIVFEKLRFQVVFSSH